MDTTKVIHTHILMIIIKTHTIYIRIPYDLSQSDIRENQTQKIGQNGTGEYGPSASVGSLHKCPPRECDLLISSLLLHLLWGEVVAQGLGVDWTPEAQLREDSCVRGRTHHAPARFAEPTSPLWRSDTAAWRAHGPIE